jgi:hypothetical protein
VRRGVEGPGCRGAAGAERVSEAESGARNGTTLTCGAIGLARAERERGAAGLGRGKRTAQEGEGEGEKKAGAGGLWARKEEGGPSVGKGKERERRWPAGWAIGPARAGFLLSFPFQTQTQTY